MKSHPQISHLSVSQAPDFVVNADPNALPIVAGAILSTIELVSLNGFSGTVNLTATVSPKSFNGPVVSLDATGFMLLAGEMSNSTLTVLTTTSTELANYNVTVTANSDSLIHNVIIELVPGRIAVQPALIGSVPKGSTFTVNIMASAVRLLGWQFDLKFDRTILSAHPNASLAAFWRDFGYQIPTTVDNATGTVSMGAVLLGSSIWFTGNDTLASITFTVNRDGLSSLHLSNQIFVTGRDTTVSIMSLVSKDGIFANTSNFFIVANPPHLDIGRGGSGVFQVAITSLNNFSGRVALATTVSALDTGQVNLPSASLSPDNVTLTSSGTAASTLHVTTTSSTAFGRYNVNITGTSGSTEQSVQVSVSITDVPPMANFTFSPVTPVAGETVTFNATSSFDPDGSIRNWFWDFSDPLGFSSGSGPVVEHSFSHAGAYAVSLEVEDNTGLTNRMVRGIMVASISHDVAVSFVSVSSRMAVSSQPVFIVVELRNNGLFNETVSLSVYYDSHIITTLENIFLQVPSPTCGLCQFGVSEQIVWNTSVVPPRGYTISATVFLASDQNLSNNNLVGDSITILPAPILRVTPSTGVLGTKVLVQGSGFPPSQFLPAGNGVLEVTFDDMFIGVAFTNNGQFNFTFNVPHADPGFHRIKTIDLGSLAQASANFQVVRSPSSATLTMSMDLGAIYFPGDTAVFYVATGIDGVPVAPTGLSLQVLLVKPDGSNTTLPITAIAPGVFKGSFAVPRALGTYSVRAIARITDKLDSSAFRSFEVKPAWLSPQSQMVMFAAGLTGLVALAAMVWRRDIIARRRDN